MLIKVGLCQGVSIETKLFHQNQLSFKKKQCIEQLDTNIKW